MLFLISLLSGLEGQIFERPSFSLSPSDHDPCRVADFRSSLIPGALSLKMADISWLTPCNGATFAAGDTIPVKWKTSRRTVSPSFRLCLSSELTSPKTRRNQNATASNECGMAIWPVVNEEKGIYCTSLSAPSRVKSHHTYVLRMEDDSGSIFESPLFSLIPSRSSTLVADTDNDPSFELPQAPFVAHMKSSSPPPHISTAHASGGTPNPTTGSSSASSRLPSSHTGSTSSPSYPVLTVLLGHEPSNAASFAVPLAVVAGVVLIAILLAVWLRRRLTKRRATDAEKLTLSRQSSKSIFKTSGELEDGMASLPGDAPIPLFMPVDLPRVQKRSQRKAVPISATYTNGRPVVRNSVKSSRALSTRSTHAQANAYPPPITLTSRGLSDEEREDSTAHPVLRDYFQPSPPMSLLPHERPPRAHVPD